MLKRGIIYGILGFLISLGTIYYKTPKVSIEEKEVKPEYANAVNGWVETADIIAEEATEAVELEDEMFINLLMEEFLNNLKGKQRITITRKDTTILWDTESARKGEKFKGWDSESKNKFVLGGNNLVVRVPIKSGEETIGFIFLTTDKRKNPAELSKSGWLNLFSLLSMSLKENVSRRNSDAIARIINNTGILERKDLLKLSIEGRNGSIIWDIKDKNTGNEFDESSFMGDKEVKGRFYGTQNINFQGNDVGEIHYLLNLPVRKVLRTETETLFPIRIFDLDNIIVPIGAFIILFIFGGLILRETEEEEEETDEFSGEKIQIKESIDELQGELEELKENKDKLTSDIAQKQKTKKELESTIEDLEKTIEEMDEIKAEPVEEMETTEIEKSEEEALFDNLLGESESKEGGEKKKEELELTQRIVAKRREEIALSGRIESKRKELVDLERKIENLKEEKEELEGEN